MTESNEETDNVATEDSTYTIPSGPSSQDPNGFNETESGKF